MAIIKLFYFVIIGFLGGLLTTSSLVLVHPESSTVIRGYNITLKCKFDENVDKCAWVTPWSELPISKFVGGYYYLRKCDNERNTVDCSLQIMQFRDKDVGRWQCVNKKPFNPFFDLSTYSSSAYLSLGEPELINSFVSVHPENATVSEGGTVILKCQFNETIKCAWFRNATAVTIEERYRYLNSSVNGEDRIDCSIEIGRFEKSDATQWQCACTVDSNLSNATCKSNFAYLTLYNSKATTESTTPVEVTKEKLIFGLDMTKFLIFVLTGLLLGSILLSTIVYFIRRNNAKGKQHLKPSVATCDTSRRQSDPAYHYIPTQQRTSEEDAVGYLVPKNALTYKQNPKDNLEYHIYHEIPEVVTCKS